MRLLTLLLIGVTLAPATVRAADGDQSVQTAKVVVVTDQPTPRPLILPTLYVSLMGLQAFDGISTLHAVNNGTAREGNVLLGGLAEKPAAFWAVKAASTAVTILLAEQLWRTHHRGEAIATMVVANGFMVYVAAHNVSVVNGSR